MLNFKRETVINPALLSQAFRWRGLYYNCCCRGSKEVDRITIVLDHCTGNRDSTPLRPPLLPGDIGPGEELQESFFLNHTQTNQAIQRNTPFLQENFAAPLLRYLKERNMCTSYWRRYGRPPGLRLGMNLYIAHAFFDRVCDRCGHMYQVLCEPGEPGQSQRWELLDSLPVEGDLQLGPELEVGEGQGAQGDAGRDRDREVLGRGGLGRGGRGRRGGAGGRGRRR